MQLDERLGGIEPAWTVLWVEESLQLPGLEPGIPQPSIHIAVPTALSRLKILLIKMYRLQSLIYWLVHSNVWMINLWQLSFGHLTQRTIGQIFEAASEYFSVNIRMYYILIRFVLKVQQTSLRVRGSGCSNYFTTSSTRCIIHREMLPCKQLTTRLNDAFEMDSREIAGGGTDRNDLAQRGEELGRDLVYWTFGFHKMFWSSRITMQLATSEERRSSLDIDK
jgi:hypothetical protein